MRNKFGENLLRNNGYRRKMRSKWCVGRAIVHREVLEGDVGDVVYDQRSKGTEGRRRRRGRVRESDVGEVGGEFRGSVCGHFGDRVELRVMFSMVLGAKGGGAGCLATVELNRIDWGLMPLITPASGHHAQRSAVR